MAVLLVVCLAAAAPFFPGLMIPDTIDMCNQAVTGLYTTWHSPIFAGVWGFAHLGPEVLFSVQVLAFVTVIYVLLARWLRPWVAVVCTVVVVFVPTTVGWLAHIGKDEWGAIALLWAIALLARVADAHGRNRTIVLVAACAFLWIATAVRHDYIISAAVVLLFAGPLSEVNGHTRRTRGLAVLTRVGLVAVFVVFTLLSQRLWIDNVVRPTTLYPQQATFQYDLTSLSIRSGRILLPASSPQPGTTLDDLRSHFTVHGGAGYGLFFSKDEPIRYVATAAAEDELQSAWLDAVKKYPGQYLSFRLSFAMSMLGVSGRYPLGAMFDTGSRPADWGLRCPLNDRYFPALFDRASGILTTVDSWPIWRMWWFGVVFVAAAALVGLRRSAEVRMLLAVSVAQLVTFAIFAVGIGWRYMWFVAVATVVTLALVLSRIPLLARRGRETKVSDDSEVPLARAAANDAGGAERDDVLEAPAAASRRQSE